MSNEPCDNVQPIFTLFWVYNFHWTSKSKKWIFLEIHFWTNAVVITEKRVSVTVNLFRSALFDTFLKCQYSLVSVFVTLFVTMFISQLSRVIVFGSFETYCSIWTIQKIFLLIYQGLLNDLPVEYTIYKLKRR